ncbi:Tyrosine recombinase XerC [Methylococcales bacterium]|nr:Tyrosine recombinase XerC [Methylococcales bacterium]
MNLITTSKEGPRPPLTIVELAERYCREIVLRPSSKDTYMTAVYIFERDMAVTAIEDVTHEIVLDWRDRLLQRASLTTWNSYRRCLKTIFNFALRNGWLVENHFLGVKPLSLSRRKKTLSKRILNEMITSLSSDSPPVTPGWFWIIAIKFLYYTGMRRRQLTSLRWRDIDFDRKTILLSVEGSKSKREWVIPIPPQCDADLRHLLHESKARHERLEACQVFWIQLFMPRYAGPELQPHQVTAAFARLSKYIGTAVSPHRLRHTMATDLASGLNPDLKSLQYLLGHTNLCTTLEYVTPEMSQLRVQMSKLSLDIQPEPD